MKPNRLQGDDVLLRIAAINSAEQAMCNEGTRLCGMSSA